MQNDYTFQIPNGTITSTPYDGAVMTITGGPTIPPSGGAFSTINGGYWLDGIFYPSLSAYSNCIAWYPSPMDNKTEKAFHVAKFLVEKKRVSVKSPAEFIALVEELREAV